MKRAAPPRRLPVLRAIFHCVRLSARISLGVCLDRQALIGMPAMQWTGDLSHIEPCVGCTQGIELRKKHEAGA